MAIKLGLYALLLAASLGLAACATPGSQKVLTTEFTEPAKLAEASEVAGCKRLGEVRGYGEPSKSGNVPLARMTAMDSMRGAAGKMGATHVVFQKYQGNRRPVAIGIAYKCE